MKPLLLAALIPFYSYNQLSEGKPQNLGTEIRMKPVKLRTIYPPITKEIYKGNNVKEWLLNKEYKIIHRTPSEELMANVQWKDTLIIQGKAFDLQQLLPDIYQPAVYSIKKLQEDGQTYLAMKIDDGAGGRHYSLNLLVFNVTDPKHIRCINQTSANVIPYVKNNIITDLDHDGRAELNLYDKGVLRAYTLTPAALKPNGKFIIEVDSQDGNCQQIDTKKSNWYFTFKKPAPRKDCSFDTDDFGLHRYE